MIQCAFCQSKIDDDSFYCDQCSKEIMVCTQCNTPGTGKRCPLDGKPLVAVKEKAVGISPATNSKKSSIASSMIESNSIAPRPSSYKSQSSLVLSNDEKGITISLEDGDIIGRTNGKHTDIFGGFGKISGNHAQVIFNQEKNSWFIKDLNTTNGTRISAGPTDWLTLPNLVPNVLTALQHGQQLLLGRTLELTVQLVQPEPNQATENGTIRI